MKFIYNLFRYTKASKGAMLLLFLGFSFGLFGQYLTGVDPDEGMQGQMLTLTVSGQNTNFMQGTYVSVTLRQGSSTIIFPNEVLTTNNEELEATFDFSFSHNPGNYSLYVWEQPDGEMMLEDAFLLVENPEQPHLLYAYPETAELGESLDVLISGQYTHFTSGTSTSVWFNQGSVTIFPDYTEVLSNTLVKPHFSFYQGYPVGNYDINTYNVVDGILTLQDGFELLPGAYPAITSMEPSSGMYGSLLQLDIYGENTHFADATIIIAYFQAPFEPIELNVEVVDNTHLQTEIVLPYTAVTGYYDLYVWTNLDGQMVKYAAFLVQENPDLPELISINPDSCYLGNQLQIAVEAQNTWFEWADNVEVWLSKTNSSEFIFPESISLISNEQLSAQFNIPEYVSAGYWDFYIYDDIDQGFNLEGGFMIIDTITGISSPQHVADINLYPNPTTGHFNIACLDAVGSCDLFIYNLAGQRKEFLNLNLDRGVPAQINIEDLDAGVYFIKMITSDKIYVQKIIKN